MSMINVLVDCQTGEAKLCLKWVSLLEYQCKNILSTIPDSDNPANINQIDNEIERG